MSRNKVKLQSGLKNIQFIVYVLNPSFNPSISLQDEIVATLLENWYRSLTFTYDSVTSQVSNVSATKIVAPTKGDGPSRKVQDEGRSCKWQEWQTAIIRMNDFDVSFTTAVTK